MNLPFHKYKITNNTDSELEISRNKNSILFESIFTVLVCVLFSSVVIGKSNFNQVGIFEISTVVIIGMAILHVVKNVKLYSEGEVYTFSKSLNQISKNGRIIGKLDAVSKIRIVEEIDAESSNLFELQIILDGYATIYFDKTSNLAFQKSLGKAIAQLTGIPFSFNSKEEMRVIEKEEDQKQSHESLVNMFEKKYASRTEKELRRIAESNSPYAGYAREAASNLLKNVIRKEG